MTFPTRLLPWLLTACIVGINGFQVYWLVHTYSLTRTQFDRTVHEALLAAVQHQLLRDEPIATVDLQVASDWVTPLSPRRSLLHHPTITLVPRKGTQPLLPAASRPPSYIVLDDWSVGSHLNVVRLTHTFRQQLIQRTIDSTTAVLDTFSRYQVPQLQPVPAQIASATPPVLLSPARSLYVQARPLPAAPYLWQHLGGLLGGSLLLLVLTGGCFLLVGHTLRAQRKLVEAKNDFINNMTHELKTPLATVTAAVETLEHFGGQADPLKVATYFRIVRTELRHLADVVEKVLTSAANEQASLVLHPELLRPAELVAAVVHRQRFYAGKAAHFSVEVASADVVSVDRFHLEGAINNLLDNAIKYSVESVRIQVSSRRTAGGWQLTVQDDGIGIASIYQAAIFDRFFRVPTGNLHPVKGFGLGLSYVRQVVEQHGGHLTVRSELGKGSAFTLWLPTVCQDGIA